MDWGSGYVVDELYKDIDNLKEQIEKLKCCQNCKHRGGWYEGYSDCDVDRCIRPMIFDGDDDLEGYIKNNYTDKWEFIGE